MSALGKQIGETIRQERNKRGMSQPEFAELIGMKEQNLSSLERGIREPGTETLEKIAEALEMIVAVQFFPKREIISIDEVE